MVLSEQGYVQVPIWGQGEVGGKEEGGGGGRRKGVVRRRKGVDEEGGRGGGGCIIITKQPLSPVRLFVTLQGR